MRTHGSYSQMVGGKTLSWSDVTGPKTKRIDRRELTPDPNRPCKNCGKPFGGHWRAVFCCRECCNAYWTAEAKARKILADPMKVRQRLCK